jgi:hypothetical protein
MSEAGKDGMDLQWSGISYGRLGFHLTKICMLGYECGFHDLRIHKKNFCLRVDAGFVTSISGSRVATPLA